MPAAEPPAGPTATLTSSAAETEALGAALAATLRPGDVVLLEGEMGAGKTTFVRGAARALGVQGAVTSPTFTLVRRYEDGRTPVSHLDLHRLTDLEDEDPGLLEEDLAPTRIAFVEWPQAAAPELAATTRVAARVLLEHAGQDARRITVEPLAPRPDGATA
jgi:tRNA threonylcarbamoyladenosine biosynthesis protein TsaE